MHYNLHSETLGLSTVKPSVSFSKQMLLLIIHSKYTITEQKIVSRGEQKIVSRGEGT